MSNMNNLTIGVIGTGRIGMMHADNVAAQPQVSDLVVIGRRQEKLEQAATTLEEASASVHTRLKDDKDNASRWLEGLDGLVIATSTDSHPELVIAAAQAGVPALVEKPLAGTLEELEATATQLEFTGTEVMVAFHRRYDAGYQNLRERLAAGEAGPVRTVHAVGHDHHHVDPDFIPSSGGLFRDMAIHEFDALPWVLGEDVVSVYAAAGVLDGERAAGYREHGDFDTATVFLGLVSGAQAVVNVGRNIGSGQDVRVEVFGSDQVLTVGFDRHTPLVSADPEVHRELHPHEDFMELFADAFQRETEHFLRVVSGEDRSLTPPRDGVKAMRIALAAEESVRTGQVVRLDS